MVCGPRRTRCSIDTEDVYERLAGFGLDYGPVFQGLGSVWRRDGEVFAEVVLPEAEHARSGSFAVHPALLDAALHAVFWRLLNGRDGTGGWWCAFAVFVGECAVWCWGFVFVACVYYGRVWGADDNAVVVCRW